MAPPIGGIVDNTERAGVHREISVDPYMAHIKEPEADRLDIVGSPVRKYQPGRSGVPQLGIVLQRGRRVVLWFDRD